MQPALTHSSTICRSRAMASILSTVSLLLLCFSILSAAAHEEDLQTYIVHIHKPPPEHNGSHRDWHHSFLRSGNVHESRLVYSYSHVLSGFAARLTAAELEAMREMEGYVHAYPDRISSVHTTHSPSFLGLHRRAGGFWSKTGFGKGVIIGVLDTGIAPEHPSFDDAGMPAPPSKWKGRCEFQFRHLCNNKLVGAYSFNLSHGDDDNTDAHRTGQPFDSSGHGTHVAGTAAGSFVSNASLLGNARGVASGVAPEAHLAMYKVCHASGCREADVVAGIEQAVSDGVDVISMSLGRLTVPMYDDAKSIAALAAVKKGVFFSVSAGNRGPARDSLENAAPWMLTVGASTMDRRIRAVVKLGNGASFEGESAYQPKGFPSALRPVVHAKHCSNITAMKAIGVEGKIVVCEFGEIGSIDMGKMVKRAGGAAMILLNPSTSGFETNSEAHLLPTSHVSYADGLAITKYVEESASTPKATILFKGTYIGGQNAPAVAPFSSRGPSRNTRGVLKPDVVGPGVNVLAAAPKAVGPFEVTPAFDMMSGTSMACPHLSGVAALLKGLHPEWSPAMIKSAIMTTADVTNLGGKPIRDLYRNRKASFYEMGSGHVNTLRAARPGLVYDLKEDDYVKYLCAIGYTDAQASVVAGHRVRCDEHGSFDAVDLNYPSIAVDLKGGNGTLRARRTVTNVGRERSTYVVRMERPHGVTMEVDREELVFSGLGEKVEYTVRFGVNTTETAGIAGTSWFREGFLTWVSSDGEFAVRSPISVRVDASSSSSGF